MTPYPKRKDYTKKPAFRSKKYLEWIRSLRCAVCGSYPPCQAAHQRVLGPYSSNQKPPDNEVLPQCYDCHMIGEHQNGIYSMWRTRSELPFEDNEDIRNHIRILCEAYYQLYQKENNAKR